MIDILQLDHLRLTLIEELLIIWSLLMQNVIFLNHQIRKTSFDHWKIVIINIFRSYIFWIYYWIKGIFFIPRRYNCYTKVTFMHRYLWHRVSFIFTFAAFNYLSKIIVHADDRPLFDWCWLFFIPIIGILVEFVLFYRTKNSQCFVLNALNIKVIYKPTFLVSIHPSLIINRLNSFVWFFYTKFVLIRTHFYLRN